MRHIFFSTPLSLLVSGSPLPFSLLYGVILLLMIRPTGARSAEASWLCAHMCTVEILCHSRFWCIAMSFRGRDNPVEIHTATPEGLSVFPLLYSSEFYSFFVWEFSDCLMISLASTPQPIVTRCIL